MLKGNPNGSTRRRSAPMIMRGPIACRTIGRPSRLACLGLGGWAACLIATSLAWAGEPSRITEVLLKIKPAVVMFTTEISGEVRLTCPNGSPQRVTPAPTRAHGTGFLITPDGYLITNGHVVQPYHESNEREQREAILRQAVEQACLATSLPEKQKRQAVSGLLVRLAPSATVEVRKKLMVVLPNRETFAADVKAYSPPLADRPGKQGSTDGGPATESGKDIAILKIDARNLPTAVLGNSDRVQLGQPVHLLGFPGVVLYHDLLDKRSAVEASVTSGTISSVKLDARGAPVIQTDAAASWGNSGGPAINEQGEVIGILTFISLTSDETQAIQGFNFLVPVNMVREFARTAGAVLGVPSPFNAVWREAVEKFGREDWAGAQTKLDAAARLVPNLPDVQRLQAETELRLLQASRWPSPWTLGGVVVALLAATGGAWWGWRRRRAQSTSAGVVAPASAPTPAPADPVRASAADLARALSERADLVLVDVREQSDYTSSSVQAKGAVRASAADVLQACSALARHQGIVLYCGSPGEAASLQAARRLMAEGYTRVVVLTGGFAAWEGASLPLERTPHARTMMVGVSPSALPTPGIARDHGMKANVDLPVGVKGAGPYFNARATTLGVTGLVLGSPEALTVGQQLRLSIFLPGEPVEVSGQVVSLDPRSPEGSEQAAEIAFEALGQDQATALEGFILAQRTAGAHRVVT
jgi:serine protease Do